jgi:hypothetical protein
MGGSLFACLTRSIRVFGRGFKVVWVDATFVATNMIHLIAVGYFTLEG